jgi:hypothetical protein
MGNRRHDDHHRCTELLTTTLEPLVLPEPLLVEIGYMLGSRAGAQAEADFLRDVTDGAYIVESMMLADIARAADLVEKYADLPLGTADGRVRHRAGRTAWCDARGHVGYASLLGGQAAAHSGVHHLGLCVWSG